jgi:hypothetical protein
MAAVRVNGQAPEALPHRHVAGPQPVQELVTTVALPASLASSARRGAGSAATFAALPFVVGLYVVHVRALV